MKNCSGLHCPGCGDSGSGVAAGLVAGLVVLALADHYAGAIGRAVSDLVTVVAITAASVAGIVLAGGIMAAVVTARKRALRRAPRTPIPRVTAQVIPGEQGIRALPPAAPGPLVNPVSGHLFACLCEPCSAYWASAPGQVVYLMTTGHPVPAELHHAAIRAHDGRPGR
jgi:hypothetical protein